MTDGAEASCGTNRAFYNHDREHKEEEKEEETVADRVYKAQLKCGSQVS